MIIMDQRSTVFFDRTKPVDERSELLDIFLNALSHVVSSPCNAAQYEEPTMSQSAMKCTAFETFWRHLDKLSVTNYQEPEFESTARKYLNINPEGQLLRDAHDILDELRMMGQIFEEQLHISEALSKHLEELTSKGSEKESTSDSTVQVLLDIRNLLEEKQVGEAKSNEAVNESTQNGKLGESQTPSTASRRLSDNRSTEKGKISETQASLTVTRQIPDKTLHRARDLTHEISQRESELQKIEDRTRYVCDQVCLL
jgi:hypothetical protein